MRVSILRPEECVVFDSDEGRHEPFPGIIVRVFWRNDDRGVGWFWHLSPQGTDSSGGFRSSTYALHNALRHLESYGVEDATYQ